MLKNLSIPFPADDIEWRMARSGIAKGKLWGQCLAYITARAVQDRLDSVVGPENWKDEYIHVPGGVMCRLSIRVNNEWIAKENGSDETDIEAFKGGISKALVRAASTWGIGRYLYALTDNWAIFVNDKTPYTAKIEGEFHNWLPPALPDWALPPLIKPVVVAPTPKPTAVSAVMIHPKPELKSEARAKELNKDPNFKRMSNDSLITEPQRKRLWAICNEKHWSEVDIKDYLQKTYKLTSSKEISYKLYNSIVEHVQLNPKVNQK